MNRDGESGDRFIAALRLVLLVTVALAAMFASARPASAVVVATWDVYPGFPVSSIYDYGWHFDEVAGPQWGARDYNYPGDAGGNVVFSAKLTQDSVYQIRWRFEQFQNCTVKVFMQINYFGWVDVDRTEMHYIHLTNRVASGTTTNVVQYNGQAVFNYLGQAGVCDILPGEEHVHESADFAPGRLLIGVRASTDTCWSNNDDFTGLYLYQCPLQVFKRHDRIPPMPSCPPGAWDVTTFRLSGTIPEYICETWSNIPQDYAYRQFYGVWTQ